MKKAQIENQLRTKFASKSMKKLSQQRKFLLESLDLEQTLHFKQKFQKTIIQPLQIVYRIQKQKMPQKCFLHNINYSLYCKEDHRPLCPDCINKYNNPHRGHRVIPLANATQEINRDIETSKKKLKKNKEDFQNLNFIINEQNSKVDEESKAIETRIREYYQSIRNSLRDHQSQVLDELTYQSYRFKCNLNTFGAQLKQVTNYIDSRMSDLQDNNDNTSILVNHNILQHLNKVEKIMKENTKVQKFKNLCLKFDYKVFDDMCSKINIQHNCILSQLKRLTLPQQNKSNLSQSPSKSMNKKSKNEQKSSNSPIKSQISNISTTRHNKSLILLRQVWK